MMIKWLIAVFAVMVIQSSSTEAAPSRSAQCTYKGYAPGGSVPQITSISATPPEEFEESVLEEALGIGETGGEIIEKALELGGATPQLAMVFGAISIALGMAQDNPSPNDILQRAHQSIQFLTEDVNNRLNQVQDYADAKDLQLERRVMTRDYKELFDKWENCLDNTLSKEEGVKCQEGVEKEVKSARFQFQPLQSLFDQKGKKKKPKYDPNFYYRYVGTWQWMNKNKGKYVNFPSYDEVKRLEIGLIPFRNYVTLHLLVLEALIKTHKALGKESCKKYTKYLKKMKEKTDYYVRYVKWAYEWIYIRQYEENRYFGVPKRAEGRSAFAELEGYRGTKSCSGKKCTVQCTQIIKDNVCSFNNAGDGKRNDEEMENICQAYLGETKDQLTKFWEAQILNVAKIWEKYGQQAKDKLTSSKCG